MQKQRQADKDAGRCSRNIVGKHRDLIERSAKLGMEEPHDRIEHQSTYRAGARAALLNPLRYVKDGVGENSPIDDARLSSLVEGAQCRHKPAGDEQLRQDLLYPCPPERWEGCLDVAQDNSDIRGGGG